MNFLFFGVVEKTLVVSALEMKKGSAEAKELAALLQGGANFADKLVRRDPGPSKVYFVPVAVYGGKLNRAERERLKQRECRVAFRGVHHEIRLARCGSPLNTLL